MADTAGRLPQNARNEAKKPLNKVYVLSRQLFASAERPPMQGKFSGKAARTFRLSETTAQQPKAETKQAGRSHETTWSESDRHDSL